MTDTNRTKDQKLHSGACTCPACSPDLWAAGIKGSKTPGECNEGLDQSRGRASNAGLGSSPPIEAPSSNHRSIHAELITLAAEFARGAAVPDWSNHKWYSSTPHSERREILKTLRDIEETMRLYAIRLRDIADKVSAEIRPAEKPACDGCGLPGTARCPHCQAVTCGDCSTCEHFRGLVPRGPTPVETTAMRSQEAFRLINAATYYVPRDREFHKDMVAWLGGASSAEASPEEPAARTNTSTGPTTVSLESPHDKDPPEAADLASGSAELCSDCPPVWYPTDTTRCAPCPRRAEKASGEPTDIELIEAVSELHHKLECDSVELDADAKRVLYSNIHRLTRRLKAREPLKCKCGRELVPYAGCPACDVPTQSGLVGPLDPPYLVGDK